MQDEYLPGRILVPVGRVCRDVFCDPGGTSCRNGGRLYPVPAILPVCLLVGDGYAIVKVTLVLLFINFMFFPIELRLESFTQILFF